MAKILILGAGVMGTAMCIPLCDNGHTVHLVGTHLDVEIINNIQKCRIHPKLQISLPDNVIPHLHTSLDYAMKSVDVVILGVSSLGINWAVKSLGPVLPPDVPILAITKGLIGDGSNVYTIPDIVKARLASEYNVKTGIAAVAGPAIAGELASRRNTSVVFTGTESELLNQLVNLLQTSYYHVWADQDPIGTEICAAFKNIYAMCVGLAQGFMETSTPVENAANMHNIAASIFAQGLWEMSHLVDKMGGRQPSVLGLPGAGDLYVTCQGGRNSRMGRFLGTGESYEHIKTHQMAGDTVEGVELGLAIGPTIETMMSNGSLNKESLPLLTNIISVICNDRPVELVWDHFFG